MSAAPPSSSTCRANISPPGGCSATRGARTRADVQHGNRRARRRGPDVRLGLPALRVLVPPLDRQDPRMVERWAGGPAQALLGERDALLQADLEYGDRLDLDQEPGLRQCGNRDHRARRHLFTEELLADRRVISAVADVGHISVDLDDVRHRAAAGFYLGFDRLQHGARLGLEVAGIGRTAFFVISDLTGDVEDRLRTGYLDGLRIGRRIKYSAGGVLLDFGHIVASSLIELWDQFRPAIQHG